MSEKPPQPGAEMDLEPRHIETDHLTTQELRVGIASGLATGRLYLTLNVSALNAHGDAVRLPTILLDPDDALVLAGFLRDRAALLEDPNTRARLEAVTEQQAGLVTPEEGVALAPGAQPAGAGRFPN